MGPNPSGLGYTFDHVVVLMLENRSFDNVLGYLYQDGVPAGKNFEGVAGKGPTNPDANGNLVGVSAGTGFRSTLYPDPGEGIRPCNDAALRLQPDNRCTAQRCRASSKDYYDTLQARCGTGLVHQFRIQSSGDHEMLRAQCDTRAERAGKRVRGLRSLVLCGSEPDMVQSSVLACGHILGLGEQPAGIRSVQSLEPQALGRFKRGADAVPLDREQVRAR